MENSSYLRCSFTIGVAKKNILNFDHEMPASVIGIACNEKIWRLAWQLNQALGMQLATAEDDVTRVKGPVLYTDHDSSNSFDYTLFENNLKATQGTKLARQFRFWLVISHNQDTPFDASGLAKQIGQIDIVSLTHDLSQEKDIKKLLP
jgi:hypothetical protein